MNEQQNIPEQQPDNRSERQQSATPENSSENSPAQPAENAPGETFFENVQNEEGMSAVTQAATLAGLHPSIKDMELHHPSPHHKKKLMDYLFEFFMLFLAITLGFFVENMREHATEKKKEKEYMRSLIEDMKTDTIKINNYVGYNNYVLAGLDSLINAIYLYKKNDTAIVRKIYQWYAYAARNHYEVSFTDRTMSQLKNSGNMRLIQKQKVSDSIVDYDDGIKLTNSQGNTNKTKCEMSLDYSGGIFDYRYLRYTFIKGSTYDFSSQQLKLLTDDPVVLTRYANMLELWKQVIVVYIQDLYGQKFKAQNLISFLKDEYNIK